MAIAGHTLRDSHGSKRRRRDGRVSPSQFNSPPVGRRLRHAMPATQGPGRLAALARVPKPPPPPPFTTGPTGFGVRLLVDLLAEWK